MKKIKELFKNRKIVTCAVITLCLIGGIAVGGYAINTTSADSKTESTKIAKTEKTESKDSAKAEKSSEETASTTSKSSAKSSSSSSSSSSGSSSSGSSGGSSSSSSGSSSGSASSSESTGHVHNWVTEHYCSDSDYAMYCPNCCVWYRGCGCPSCGSGGFESGTCVTEYTYFRYCTICGAEEVLYTEAHDISEGLQS